MLTRLRNTWRPASFQGHGWTAPYFEGWYIKLVDADRGRPLALIPGIYRATSPSESHCFLQVFDGGRQRAWYLRYPLDAFEAHATELDVRLGSSRFSVRGTMGRVELDIDHDDLALHGSLVLDGVQGWPVRPLSPGVMGPFGLLPFLECYHGVVGFDHGVAGRLDLDGEAIDYTNGRGYIEKDWGSSFPQSWIWCQCNHFEAPGYRARRVCLTASIAEIPNLGRTFPGFIVGVWIDGTLYPFTTHDLAVVDVLRVTDDDVRWVLHNRTHRLEITVTRAPPTMLPGPTIEGMKREVHETLTAKVHIRLSSRRGGAVEYEGEGSCAGLEVQGDIPHLSRVARSQ